MQGRDAAAALRGMAKGADESLGTAGHALGDFIEKVAATADKTTDAILATEEQNARAIAKVMPGGAASDDPAAAARTVAAPQPRPSGRGALSGVLDPRGAAAGGWEGEAGLYLSPRENAAADRFLARAADAEAKITPVVIGIRDALPGAQSAGFPQCVLKSPESVKRKLATQLSESPIRDVDTALDDLKDSVRYTLVFPGESTAYADGVNAAIRRLRDASFENVRFRNAWGGAGYQGVNSFWRDPRSGHVFEVQFHTPESFEAKTVTHELYERARIPGVPEAGVRQFRARQDEIFGAVPRPLGAAAVKLSAG